MPKRNVPPVTDDPKVQRTELAMDMHGYTLFSHAIKDVERLTVPSEKKRFIAGIDRHNIEIIRKMIRAVKKLVLLQEAMSMQKMIGQLESALALADEAMAIGKEHQDLAFVIIDKLVRENRVQKDPAARIGKALEILFSDQDHTFDQINKEVRKLNTSNELAEHYVAAISQLDKPKLSLQELASVSGYSKAVWSKHLREDSSMMVTIRGRLRSKLNLAKTDDRRELWIKANDVIDQKGIVMAERVQKNRESPRDMSKHVPTASDRRRSSGGKGQQHYAEHAKADEDVSWEVEGTQ